ncbi:MAG: NAD(P)H-dependent glycerol-3-phosphate dehydrogenase [Oscillospiraceae bacterium]|nr:NAD(P)H-dependent glycerol-3-phosphate dehydrogenase [Oscillospiraceae bacterium]
MMKVAVIGSGGWGTALAVMLAKTGSEVTLWSFDEKEYQRLFNDRENRAFLPGVLFPEGMKCTNDLSVAKDADIVVMAVPSFAVRTTARKLSEYITDKHIVVNVSKGIEKDTSKRLSEVIEEEISASCDIVVLSGPSHAEEVGRGVPTAIIATSRSKKAAETVQDVFMNENFRVYITDDIVGVELGAALKNVMALAAGVCDGLGLGDNTKAALMTRGLAEMVRLGIALGGKEETFAGLAGLGDLIVTCMSMHSRNRRAGILIGQGTTTDKAIEKIGAVVEGYYATQSAVELARRVNIEMPITQEVYKMLFENADPKEALYTLMTRDKKKESNTAWK